MTDDGYLDLTPAPLVRRALSQGYEHRPVSGQPV